MVNFEFKETIQSKNIILDIDLDFFSTRDPFKHMFKSTDEYELFKTVYKPHINLSSDSSPSQIEAYLAHKKLRNKQIWSYLSLENKHQDISNDSGIYLGLWTCWGFQKYFENCWNWKDLVKLRQIIETNNLDAELLHSYGCGMDDCALPDHVSLVLLINYPFIFFK